MKHLYILFPIFVLIITLSLNVYADSTPQVYVEDAIKYENSENVTIKIGMENANKDIVTLGLDVKYDTSKLEYISSKAGKDLEATLNLAEDIPNESRVAIGIVSLGGLNSNGEYYYVTFKVKDDSSDIPVSLNIRESTDSKGNDIKVETGNGTIKMSSKKKKEDNKKQTIKNFETEDVQEIETIENIISKNADIEIKPEDSITYEVENSNIAEIANNGLIIPNQEGITNVKVKLNGQEIGTVAIGVKDGKVQKVSSSQKEIVSSDEKSENSNEEQIENSDISEKETIVVSANAETEKTNIGENEKTFNNYIAIIIIFVIIILIFIIILIKKGRKKRKNGKIY